MRCPDCGAELADAGEARLDQSGSTHLPARRWACDRCATVVTVRTSDLWESTPLPAMTAGRKE